MDQIPNKILEDIINLLPVKKQLVVKSVSRKFNALALNTTTVLNLEEIPTNRWLEVAKQMPKLTSLTGFRICLDPVPNPDPEISFMKELATFNKNIINITPRLGFLPERSLMKCYIESVKKQDPSYTGSGLNVTFEKESYMQLLKKYPDLDIKCMLYFDSNAGIYGQEFDRPENFLSNEGKTFNFSHVATLYFGTFHFKAISEHGVAEILERTVNLIFLRIHMIIADPSMKFHRIFEAIGKLRYLKTLQLQCSSPSTENQYKMSAEDYTIFRKAISIPTLRSLHLEYGLTVDHQNFYDCIIGSMNNNLDHLYVSFRGRDFFIESKYEPFDVMNNKIDRRTFIPSNVTSDRDVRTQHQIYAGSLRKFSIVDFVNKFSNSRPRSFEIANDHDSNGRKSNMIMGYIHKWDTVQTEFEKFMKSHPDHKYTLKRITHFYDESWRRMAIGLSFLCHTYLVLLLCFIFCQLNNCEQEE